MMTDTSQDNIDYSANPAVSVGATLREARERRQLSVEDIHNRLRISLRQIVALENDDFAVLPESTITRGFIRNYAKFLEIDAEPLLNAYKSSVQEPEHKNISIPSANIPISKRQPTDWKKYVYASLVIVLGVVGWLIYNDAAIHSFIMSQTSTPAEKQAEPVAPPTENHEPLPMPALPQAERTPEVAADPATAASQAQAQTQAVVTGEDQAAATNQLPATNPAPAETPAAASTAGKLSLSFNEDSWVSITDSTGKEIFNKTKRAGSQDEVDGVPPFKIIIGNAGGSQLSYNGKQIDLAPYTRLNVARITLE